MLDSWKIRITVLSIFFFLSGEGAMGFFYLTVIFFFFFFFWGGGYVVLFFFYVSVIFFLSFSFFFFFFLIGKKFTILRINNHFGRQIFV